LIEGAVEAAVELFDMLEVGQLGGVGHIGRHTIGEVALGMAEMMVAMRSM
jgi:hypothetical protein